MQILEVKLPQGYLVEWLASSSTGLPNFGSGSQSLSVKPDCAENSKQTEERQQRFFPSGITGTVRFLKS